MSHEQSETIQLPNGRWANVYGHALPKAGQRLENVDYATMEEAVSAAKARSKSFDDPFKALGFKEAPAAGVDFDALGFKPGQPATDPAKPEPYKFELTPSAAFGVPPKGFGMGATDEEVLKQLAETGEFQYGDSLLYGAAKVGASIAGYGAGGPLGATALESQVRQAALVHGLDKAVKAGAINEDRAWEIFAKEMASGTTEDLAWNTAIPFLGALAQKTPGLRPLIQKFAQKIAERIPRTAAGKIMPADEARQLERRTASLQAKAPTPAGEEAVGELAARTPGDLVPTPGQVTGQAGFMERVGRAAGPDKFAAQEKALQEAAEGLRQEKLGISLAPDAPSLREGIGSTITDLAEEAQKAMKQRLRPTFQAADDLGVKVDFSDVVARAKAALKADAAVPGGRLAPQERTSLATLVEDLEQAQKNRRFVGPPKVSAEAALDFISRQKEKLRSITADWKPSAFYETVVNGITKSADEAFGKAAQMAGKPEVAANLKAAQSQYREMMETVYEDAVKTALKRNPEDVGRLFWQRGNVSEPKQLQKMLALAQREGVKTAGEARQLNGKMVQGFLQEGAPTIDAAAQWSRKLAENPALRDTWNVLTSAPGGKEFRAAMEMLEEASKIATRGSAPVQVGGVPIRRALGGGLGASFVTGAIHPGMFATGLALIPMTKMLATAYAHGNKGILNMAMRALRASSAGTAAGAKAAQAAWPELERYAAENGIELFPSVPSGPSEPEPR